MPSSERIFSLEGALKIMIDHEKFQKGRMWAYAAGAFIVAVVVAWRFVSR